jgi:hypothetical protein
MMISDLVSKVVMLCCGTDLVYMRWLVSEKEDKLFIVFEPNYKLNLDSVPGLKNVYFSASIIKKLGKHIGG